MKEFLMMVFVLGLTCSLKAQKTILESTIYPLDNKQLKLNRDSSTYSAITADSRSNRREITLYMFALNAKLTGNHLWGGGFEIKLYLKNKWSTGVLLAIAGRRISDTFSFSIAKPVVSYAEMGWLNQYDIIQKNKLRVGLQLATNFGFAELRDKAQKVRERTRYGYRDLPKKVAVNTYYIAAPGLDISFKLKSINNSPDIYLTANSKYRVAVGNKRFGPTDAYLGPLFSIGISLIGYSDE